MVCMRSQQARGIFSFRVLKVLAKKLAHGKKNSHNILFSLSLSVDKQQPEKKYFPPARMFFHNNNTIGIV